MAEEHVVDGGELVDHVAAERVRAEPRLARRDFVDVHLVRGRVRVRVRVRFRVKVRVRVRSGT